MQVTEALREIDMATAPAFLAAIREMIDGADNRAVVVDCSEITFMDSSAFHVLMEAHRYAVEQDHSLVVWGLAANCTRLLEMCDRQHVLTLAP